MDDHQLARLTEAHAAVEHAERVEREARKVHGEVLLGLARKGCGPTAIAAAINADPAPWRQVHRVTVSDAIKAAAGEAGGARARSFRGQVLDPADRDAVRAAHRALYEAGVAVDDAIDHRIEVWLALTDEGVPMRQQAAALGVAPATVQVPVMAAKRATGRPRNNRRRA